jgi:hypothetical protein
MSKIFSLFILTAFFLSSFTAAADGRQYIDYIYKIDAPYLYDQTDILESKAYKAASPEQRETLLQNEFLSRKSALYRRVAIVNTLKTAAIGAGTAVTAVVLYLSAMRLKARFLPAAAPVDGAAPAQNGITAEGLAGGVFGGIGGIAIVMQTLNGPFAAAKEAVEGAFSSGLKYLAEVRNSDKIELLELKYVAKKPEMPENYRRKLEGYFEEVRTSVNYSNDYDPSAFASKLLQLPTQNHEFEFDQDKLRKRLIGYAPQTQEALIKSALRHYLSIRKEALRRQVTYYYGRAGTGKTRAAEVVASSADIPAVTMSISEILDADAGGIFGNSKNPGFIARAMIESVERNGRSAKNIMIVINDFDRILNNAKHVETFIAFLQLLEPGTQFYFDRYFKMNIDIQNVWIVITGNSRMTDEALARRLEAIDFESFSKEYRKYEVENTLLPVWAKVYEIDLSTLTPEDRAEFDRIIDQDETPGFGFVEKHIRDFLAKRYLEKRKAQVRE